MRKHQLAVSPVVVNLSYAEQPDALLLSRVVRGDCLAFGELYSRWAPMLHGLTSKILGDQKEAEDATAEGFLHVWNRASTYDATRSSASTWACLIFRNKAIDRLRARGRRGRGLEEIAAEKSSQEIISGVSGLLAELNERQQAVQTAMLQISEDEREAIRMAFYSGLTQTEIAGRLGAPLGTIKARVRRGLTKLGAGLEGQL